MKQDQISDALNMLDDKIIEETAEIRNHKQKQAQSWMVWAASAACLALLTYAGIQLLPQQSALPGDSSDPVSIPVETPDDSTEAPADSTEIPDDSAEAPADSAETLDDSTEAPAESAETPDDSTEAPDNFPELPLLPIEEELGMGMGYEGYIAFDVSELVSGNPWNEEMDFSTLPVYQNPVTFDSMFVAYGVDFDQMREFLLDIAGRLGLDTASLAITDNASDQEESLREYVRTQGGDVPEEYANPTKYIAQTGGVTIEVDNTMCADISFDPALPLPDEYNYYLDASYEDHMAAAEYLKENYASIMGMKNPQTAISGGDYNIYLDQHHYINFYDAADNDLSRIINYNFRRVQFFCDFEGKLYLIRIYRPGLSVKVGDYPVITAGKAKELLLSGSYLTSVPYEFPGEDYVMKCELIYRTGSLNRYFIPYYRFYVEIPDADYPNEMDGSGIKTYGAYYVPAVERRYLTGMPTWDGQIN